jgi:hypothetical protein
MRPILLVYRQEDSLAMAGRVQMRLAAIFGKERVLTHLPLKSSPADGNEPAMPIRIIGVMLVVIGPRWLDLVDDQKMRYIDDPNDRVRLEIEAAMQRGIPIIPLLVDGAHMPSSTHLPPSIQGITRRSGLQVQYDPYFDGDLRKVVATMRRWVSPSLGSRLNRFFSKRGIFLLSGISMASWLVAITLLVAGAANDNNPTAIVGLVLLLLGFLLAFLPWILAIVKTARLGRWGWFIALVMVGLMNFILGPALITLIYGIFGPERRKV